MEELLGLILGTQAKIIQKISIVVVFLSNYAR
jgi:hypothetical protein